MPVRDFRTHLAELLDKVVDRREHVTVTRRGRPAAVLVPVDEYEALEETAEILSDEDTLEAIRRGLEDLAAGDVVDPYGRAQSPAGLNRSSANTHDWSGGPCRTRTRAAGLKVRSSTR